MVKKPPSKSASKPRPASKSSGTKHPSKPKGDEIASADTSSPQHQPPQQDPLHQQTLLAIFNTAFHSVLSSDTLHQTLQQVKTALFNRDFDTAFGNETFLEAYAARWSPTRALCYASALAGIQNHLEALHRAPDDDDNDDDAPPPQLKVLAVGGAAAELVALGSYLSRHQTPAGAALSGAVTLLDVAPWSRVVDKLLAGLTTPPPLSKYASAAARAANAALVARERLRDVSFRQHDALALDKDGVAALVGAERGARPLLVTLLFTLNELFTAGGVGRTTAFLLTLTSLLPPGSLLLVIDSPGSYSETTVGKDAKKYPMQWLLDKILLESSRDDGGSDGWEKVESQDSVWFRLSPGLRYPIQLEDMRYQLHLYRRTGGREHED